MLPLTRNFPTILNLVESDCKDAEYAIVPVAIPINQYLSTSIIGKKYVYVEM